MHYAAHIGHTMHNDAAKFGWTGAESATHNWDKLVETVQNHVRSLNFGYRGGLRSNKVEYINALASFADDHTLEYTLKGEKKTISAANILIATGGRPTVPTDVPGAVECAITSDDFFSLAQTPGKSLVVGASYIALECAGVLNSLGFDTTVSVRSILLRGFDRQCADKIGEIMKCTGTKFVSKLPTSMTKGDDGKITVTFSDNTQDQFDTVMYATGRYADTRGLNLPNAGVTCEANGKFSVNELEQTNVPHIYAIGDILRDKPELTPVAIKTGELLAKRLFTDSKTLMDWDLVATTVFTPVEYGCVGLSEEEATKRFGDDVRTYLFEFTTLEHAAVHREKVPAMCADEFDVDMPPSCLAKLVCLKSRNERVIGFHFVGPNAGEITQGFGLALRLGATKADFDNTVGIHPTDAEAFMTMSITRESGESWIAAGGCGGGKCG
jgi:thioredoxin reductase (NADPH)